MQSETEPILFPEAEAALGSLSAEERLDWCQFGWGVLAETAENTQDGQGGGELLGRTPLTGFSGRTRGTQVCGQFGLSVDFREMKICSE